MNIKHICYYILPGLDIKRLQQEEKVIDNYFIGYKMRHIEMLMRNIRSKKTIVTLEFIQKTVCNYFNISVEKMNLPTRKRESVQPRQIAHYFSRKYTKCSFYEIGHNIGGKDHATSMNSIRVVNNLIDTDRIFRAQIEEIERRLK